jgi:hypothetical protein
MFWQSSKEDLLLTKSVVGGSGPITDMVGIWNALKDDHMTAHDRLIVLYEVNRLLAAAQSVFTKIQQDALSRCISDELNTLGPTPVY